MRMSISTRSGLSLRAGARPCSPSVGLADDLEVVLGVDQHAQAGADEVLVVGDQDPLVTAAPPRGSRR